MSKKRQRRKKAPPPPPPTQPGWIQGLRNLLLVEAGAITLILLYLRFTGFEEGADAWLATIVMILVSVLALLTSYAASGPRKPRRVQLGWIGAGLIGGTAIIAYLITLIMGMGGSTAALGIIVLPFYHWALIALMLLGLSILDWMKR